MRIVILLFLASFAVQFGFAQQQESKKEIEPTWESLRDNYHVPQWYLDGKFGIFLHWGVYTVPAKQSEWYPRHMYSNKGIAEWHKEKWGPQDKFGYKDFIPLFKAEKWNPDEWAELFKKAGATYVVPTAEHHDGFALWDSDLTKWDAVEMGPKRDLIGDLAKAVRKQGLKFGVSNHGMEHWDFMYPQLDIPNDLFDPAYADFYGPPQKPGTPISVEFQKNFWFARNKELVDKYKPDMVWFDNGVNGRELDSIKLAFAAYYYNKAREWGKEVSISTKKEAYPYGSILDFERQGRAPEIMTNRVWQVDDPIGNKFGYIADIEYQTAGSIIRKLVENVSRNGNLLLNISPRADGTIPEEQKQILLEVGNWMKVNGEGIYSTRPWVKFGEGQSLDATGKEKQEFRFTRKGDVLYAFVMKWTGEEAVITSLSSESGFAGTIKSVELLGHTGKLQFTQDKQGLKIKLPAEPPSKYIAALKITGANMEWPSLKFDFGSGKVATGYKQVLPNDTYNKERGYGIISAGNIQGVSRKGKDALRDDFITSDKPFYFVTNLDEGNYRISITFGDSKESTRTTVKAESRRLMLEKVETKPDQFVTKTFTVNIRTPRINQKDSIRLKSREIGYLNWDDKLTLEFNGAKPVVNGIEITKVNDAVVVYLAGNSTVVDQEKEPWAAWGQMIPRFFKPQVVVANFAESGEALKSFEGERRLEKVESLMKQGDYLFIEFAHNDQKPGGAHVDAFTTYKDELKKFIQAARERGAIPVLVTSMHRRRFDENGKIINTLEDYPEAMRQMAKEENVALIDLNAMSKKFYEALGVEESKKAFVHYPANTYPGQDKALEDNTHFNNYGAYQLSKCIVEGIKENIPDLARYLLDGLPAYDPAKPDPLTTWNFPPSPSITNVKPDGN